MPVFADLVTIGKVLRPFGVRGEVRVESLTDVPGRFEGLPAVTLVAPSGKSVETTIIRARKAGRGYIVGFAMFSSPEDALPFQGALMQIPQESVPPLPPTQYYHFELIGLEVEDETGRKLGQVEDIWELPHHHVVVVRFGKRETLIPALRQVITEVDFHNGILRVAPLEQWGYDHAV